MEAGERTGPFTIGGIRNLVSKGKVGEQTLAWKTGMGDWKAIRTGLKQKRGSTKIQLYNLKEDIGERRNIAGKHPEVVEKIKEYLKTATDDYRPYEHQNYPPVETYVR